MARRLASGLALALLVLLAVFRPDVPEVAADAGGALRVDAIDISSYPEVSLTVSVVGEDGKLARGLDSSSFEIAQAGRPVSAFEVKEERTGPIALVIAIDTSGSMIGSIESSKAAALELLAQLKPDDQVALTTFDNRAEPIIQALTADRDLVRSSIEGLQAFPGRETAFYSGLYQAVRLASESPLNGKSVVVFTDGEEHGSRSGSSPEEIKALAVSQGVQVNTVYVGHEAASPLFEELPNITGGQRSQPASSAMAELTSHLNETLRSRYTVHMRGTAADLASGRMATEISMKVQASASAETAFSLCQFAPAPVVWIPQLDQGSKLGKQQRIQPEVLCNEGNPIQEVRYLLDGDLVETAKAPSFSHQLLTEKLARGEHELQADVLLGDGTRISSGPATFKLSGNAFNPAYLLLVLALGLVIVGGFVMASRRRAERHSSDLPRPPMPPASAPLPSPRPAVPAAPQASSPLPARAPKLRVVTGPNEGQTYELGNTVTLGRSPGVGVLLSGSSVSREHARIVRRGPLYQLRDLGSTNGTRINGRRIAEATLTPGDRIEISPYVLLFDA